MTINDYIILFLLNFLNQHEFLKEIENFIAHHDISDIPSNFYDWIVDDEINHSTLIDYLQSQYSDFSLNGIETEIVLAKHLLLNIKQYLDGNISESVFCYQFSQVEVHFFNHQRLFSNVVYYPEWLGNLYDVCDWCEETDWQDEQKQWFQQQLLQQSNIIQNWLTFNVQEA